MSSGRAYQTLSRGISDDVRRIEIFRQLLESQYESLLKRDVHGLLRSGDKIVVLSKQLDVGGPARKTLAKLFAPVVKSVATESRRSYRDGADWRTLANAWHDLHSEILACRTLHLRNLALMVAQMEIAQFILNEERHTYAGS